MQNEGFAMDTTMGTFTFFILLCIERQIIMQPQRTHLCTSRWNLKHLFLSELKLNVPKWSSFSRFCYCTVTFMFHCCRTTKKMLKCSWKSVKTHCGESAAEWQYQMHRAIIKPTMDWGHCDLGKEVFM